ncbi:MAG: GNAT family protein [bacterium]
MTDPATTDRLGSDRRARVPATPAPDPDAWFALPVLTGTLVTLRPLTAEDADAYLAAARADGGGDEVFRWLLDPAPTDRAEAIQQVQAGLAARARGVRYPLAQLDSSTGTLIGSTSLYEVDPTTRTLAIGYTWLGRPWWRTGHNTESKLLLLTHAFDRLGAVRVVWHTDINNARSQAAIARLGATREGLLRKHRIRRNGTWRDTVQYAMTDDDWPAARDFLSGRLHERRGRRCAPDRLS